MKILIVKRDKVGDLLLATPMIQVLRAALPHARIDVLATDYNAWVLAGFPHVDRVWTYRRARMGRRISPGAALGQALLWLRLRLRRYDVAIAANGEASPRATHRALLIGAKRTIAYSNRSLRGLTDALPPPISGHEREGLLALLEPLGIAPPLVAPDPCFRPRAAVRDAAAAWLAERGMQPGTFVVIGLGARRARKQPDPGQVLRWSAAFRERHGLATVFMWTPGASNDPRYPGDDAIASIVTQAGVAGLHPFRGPLEMAAALAWHARTCVFPDSGLMHLAAASPGGVLGLFADVGASPPPEKWGPLGERAQWLAAERRVADLPDEEVLERVAWLLAQPHVAAVAREKAQD